MTTILKSIITCLLFMLPGIIMITFFEMIFIGIYFVLVGAVLHILYPYIYDKLRGVNNE